MSKTIICVCGHTNEYHNDFNTPSTLIKNMGSCKEHECSCKGFYKWVVLGTVDKHEWGLMGAVDKNV